MPTTVTEYRCLLISPSDVENERIALVRVVDQWNAHVGRALNTRLTLVKWESHAVPDSRSSGQDSLNTQIVDDCDFAIAIFWTRLGTATTSAQSGSVEEIERLTRQGTRVLTYFSSAPIPQESLQDDQFQRLQSFKQKMLEESFVATYGDVKDLCDKVQLHVTSVVADLLQKDRGQPMPPAKVATAPVPDVRVVVNASIVAPGNRAATSVLQVVVQNHSPVAVYIRTIALRCDDGTSAFVPTDAVLGTPLNRRRLNPGESYGFFYGLDVLREILEKAHILYAYAMDDIDREFRSDPTEFGRVLNQLLASDTNAEQSNNP